MSEVTNESTPFQAGNTVDTLAPVAAEETISEVVVEAPVAEPVQVTERSDDPLDEENTFDVSRAEFNELQGAFLRLAQRIAKYNEGAPHKI